MLQRELIDGDSRYGNEPLEGSRPAENSAEFSDIC
jgi:hypothetical protein